MSGRQNGVNRCSVLCRSANLFIPSNDVFASADEIFSGQFVGRHKKTSADSRPTEQARRNDATINAD